jgi:chromosome segregation ATPase
MMHHISLKLAIIAAIIFCFTSIVHATSSSDTVTGEDIKKETQDLIDTIQQYSIDQRDEAIKKADQAINRIDGRIDELENRVDTNWDKMTQAARQQTRANLKELRKQRNKLAEWYGGFKNSSSDAWNQMKKGFSDAYKTISNSWEKAKNEYDADSSKK